MGKNFSLTTSLLFCFLVMIQIVAEKQKFRKTPYNYAQKKNNLIRSKVCTVEDKIILFAVAS